MRHHQSEIEPGLLPIFRLFIGLEAVAFLVVILSYSFASGEAETRFVIDLYGCWLLLGYLSWPTLQHKLGVWYLPLGLAASALIPLAASQIYLVVTPETDLAVLVLSAWELIPMLFVPLVLTAWQYGFWGVVIFCVLPAALDISLALTIADRLEQSPFRILSVVVIRSASLFVVGYIVAQLRHTQREQRRALLAANQQLSRHAHTVAQLAASRERNRLARELHDTLAHTLSALAVNLEALKTVLTAEMAAEAHELLDRALHITRTGLTETRRALKDLRASPLEDLGLSLALRNLTQALAARAGLIAAIDIAECDLPEQLEQEVYRVAQEALENVARHANARHISIRLQRVGRRLLLQVCDDGTGFDLDSESRRDTFGIRGMQERAAMCGGRLSLFSAPGKGTTVHFELELPAQEEVEDNVSPFDLRRSGNYP